MTISSLIESWHDGNLSTYTWPSKFPQTPIEEPMMLPRALIPSRFPYITIKQPGCEDEGHCTIPCYDFTAGEDLRIRQLTSWAYQIRASTNLTQVNLQTVEVLGHVTAYDMLRMLKSHESLWLIHRRCIALAAAYDGAVGTDDIDEWERALDHIVTTLHRVYQVVGKLAMLQFYSSEFYKSMLWALDEGCRTVRYDRHSEDNRRSDDDSTVCVIGTGKSHEITLPR